MIKVASTRISWLARLVGFASLTTLGCQFNESHDNHLRYLQEGDQQCVQHSADRMNYINSLPSGFISGFQGGQMDVAKNRVAGVPDRDLEHLLWTFSSRKLSGIKPAALFFGVAGLTTLQSGATKNGFRGMVATSITTGGSQAGFAMQHEVGHAVEIVAREAAQRTEFANFDQALRDIVAELNSKGGMIRGYAKSSPAEAWAEAYANYYCSPNSQAFIKDNLPKTYRLLTTVLPPAQWALQNPPAPPPSPGPAPAPAPGPIAAQPPLPPPATGSIPPTSVAANSEPGGLGSWLDKIIQGLDPAAAKADAASRKAFFDSAEGSVKAIKLAVVDDDAGDAEAGLMFAADEEIDRISLCFGPADSCASKRALTPADEKSAILRRKVIKGRSFFGTYYVRPDQVQYLTQPWTALGYGEDGTLLASRRFMLVGKAQNGN
jgi:hypothetical protein